MEKNESTLQIKTTNKNDRKHQIEKSSQIMIVMIEEVTDTALKVTS